jgi:KUP system potassium uptake protein
LGLLVAAVGVVYGDIGTSPLYTLKEVFSGHYGVQVNHDGVLGILSLIFWSLIWVVSIKYVLFILRANNQGEGGIMALTALARRAAAPYPHMSKVLVLLGLFGAALFYGDSMITPAISVLSAVEGLQLAFDGIEHWVVPLSVIVLVALFLIQKHGTTESASCLDRSWCCGSWCWARLACLGFCSARKCCRRSTLPGPCSSSWFIRASVSRFLVLSCWH